MYKKQLETKKCICEHHQHPNEFIAVTLKAHLILAPACSLPFNLQMTVSPNTVLSINRCHEYTKGSREAGYLLAVQLGLIILSLSFCYSLKGIHPVSCWAAGGLIKRGYAYWPLYGHPMQVKCEHQMSSFLFIIMKFPSFRNTNLLPFSDTSLLQAVISLCLLPVEWISILTGCAALLRTNPWAASDQHSLQKRNWSNPLIKRESISQITNNLP